MFRHVDIDLVTIVIAYFMIYYGKTVAGIFAVCQGFLIDTMSAGVLGLFTFLYVVTFLGINLGSFVFDLNAARGQIILISLAVLLKETLLVALLRTFSFEISISSSNMLAFVVSALGTGLISPMLFYFLNRMNLLFTGVKQDD